MSDRPDVTELPEVTEHWMYQGRQQHGWFGSGTAPPRDDDKSYYDFSTLFSPLNIGKRIDYVASIVIGHVPRRNQMMSGATFDADARGRLKTALAAWYGASRLSSTDFRDTLLNPSTSGDAVDHLRQAARGMVEATTREALGAAAENIAAAIQKIGIGNWPRFLADFSRRAIAAATKGLIPGVTAADPAATTVSSSSVSLGDLSLRFQTTNDISGTAKATTPPSVQAAGSATAVSPIRDSGLQIVSSDGTPGGNRRQNEQVNRVAQILGLSK